MRRGGITAALLVALASGGLALAQERGAGGRDELPRGGFSVFPEHRVVGFYGAPQSPQLGELGIGSPESAAKRLLRQARPYKRMGKKPVLPVFELLGTIALAGPGPDGLYRARQPNRVIRRYARVARDRRFLLMLDIQPGRTRFIDEVEHLRPWLEKPFVSVALDPEWNMGPSGVPGERIGSVSADMVNRVTRFLARLVRRHDLPQKLVVVHQFTDGMVRNKSQLKVRNNVDLVLNADGFGTKAAKRSKYEQLAPSRRSGIYPGFKLFYEEDTGLMSPREVLRLKPAPKFVVYE